MFKKNKKKDKKETAEELRAKLADLGEPEELPAIGEPEEEGEEIPGELPPPIEQPEKPKKEKKVGEATLEVNDIFSLNSEDTSLVIEALVGRPELKVYNDYVVGKEFARIIQGYNKSVKEELDAADEGQSSE